MAMPIPETSRIVDPRWARGGATAGIIALLSYLALNALARPGPVAVILAFAFSFGFIVATIGVHLGVTGNVAPRLGLLAVIANSAAAVELLAMLLVQLAVKTAEPQPNAAFTAIWLGLDVAWDLFGGAGTVLLAAALWSHASFRPFTAGAGIAVGTLLLALNVATFPTPPAAAGLFDAGPLVGLWYVIAMVQILFLCRTSGAARAA